WLGKHGKREAVAFDITSISSYSDGMSDGEWGRDRDGKALPQMNLGLAVNCGSGVPVSYRTCPGSIPDAAVLKRLVAEFSSQCVLSEMILDRGFHSEANLKAVEQSNGKSVLTEISKKQREVMKEFGLTPPVL
ncbi:MAG: transposase, partial [Kiritimatiellaeota bacterium]|nr:transposase [Kiritimatiellota bacterium]